MTDFSWTTAFVSAGVSAIVSLLVAPRSAVAQRRALEREQARVAVRQTVAVMRMKVMRYQNHLEMSLHRRDPSTSHQSDADFAREVLSASKGLGRLRRTLVKRRLTKLVGRFYTDMGEISGDLSSEETLGAHIVEAMNTDQSYVDATSGLLHLALSQEPESRQVRELGVQLSRLAQSR